MLSSVVLASADLSPVGSLPNENSISTTPTPTYKVDTTLLSQQEIDRLFWKPNPMRSVWLGAIGPGLRQVHSPSYWEVPIVH